MITIYGAGSNISYEEIGAIELLRSQGIKLNVLLSPTASEADLYVAKTTLSQFYVDVSIYKTGDFEKSGVVISFGRPLIFDLIRKTEDRPKKLAYGLQETTASSVEVKALADGLIDEIFIQSPKRGAQTVSDLVTRAQRGVEYRAGYVPFCNPTSDFNKLEYVERKSPHSFEVLIETPDSSKYCFEDHWSMLCGVTAPFDKTKKVNILNWGKELTKKAGDPSNENCKWHGEIDANIMRRSPTLDERKEAYANAHVLLHFYPADDVFCFSAARAILSGTVVIGSPLPAFVDLVNHGETGFLARSADEAAYFTSRVAWEPHLRAKLASEAYKWFVVDGPGNADKCLPWWGPIIAWT